jgi:predicted nucleotidyltransferase
VIAALGRWARELERRNPNVVRVGYFGSLARGDYGVGSDADVVVIVKVAARPWMERPLELDPPRLPVSADLLVYTVEEWQEIVKRPDRFGGEMRGVVWV